MAGSFPAPVRRSLTQPLLLAGLPKAVAIIHWTVSTAIIITGQQYWFIVVALSIHCVLALLTKYDPAAFALLRRAVFVRRAGRRRLDP